MAEITAASGVQPSTMYQYFSNKDEIVWAIVERLDAGSSRARQAGIDERAPTRWPESPRCSNSWPMSWRTTRSRSASWRSSTPCTRATGRPNGFSRWNRKSTREGFQFFTDLIREGIADGSLRPDLDPDLTMHAVINAVIGAQRRLASLGNKVELEYGQPIDRLFRETIRMILLGLRAPETPAARHPRKARKPRKGNTRKRSSMKLHSVADRASRASLACFVPISMSAANADTPRQELAADAGWKFFLGDPGGAEASLVR